jgi:hypothetical protein
MNSQQSPHELNVSFHMCEVRHIVFILSGNCRLVLPVGSPRHRLTDRRTRGGAAGGGVGGGTVTTHVFVYFLSSI